MTYRILGEVDAQHRVIAIAPLDIPVGPVELIVEVPEDEEPDSLMELIERCSFHSGIGDLAHQHDHYLYGTPKKEEP